MIPNSCDRPRAPAETAGLALGITTFLAMALRANSGAHGHALF